MIDPSGKPMMASPAELQRFHKMLGQLDKGRPKAVNVVASAIDGAILGALIGWAVHRKEHGHREIGKHALYGAGIGGGLGLLAYAIFKGASVGAHFVESEAARELQGLPTQTELMLPLPTDPQYAAGAWGWGWGEHPHHHGWGEHEQHGWGDHGWGEHHEQPWWHRHRHFSRQRPWHEEVVFEPQQPAITYGPASAEEQAAAYSHGGLQ
jgi:hypothetical protein